ncbi:MAG: hypothetical protein EBR01_03250 [Proteobacteria bacterium]|jgi:hypothetical protein|nr:hypothetical protein [Pseudomonadota bacterium]NBY20900.1 hypothetical protein [bacterium]
MNFNHWVRSFLLLGLVFFSTVGARLLADQWRPSSQSYQAREFKEDCSLIKSVHSKTKNMLDRRLNDLKSITASTQANFKALSECQKKNGILNADSDEGQTQTAMMCSETYELWLLDGTHLLTVEEEIEVLKSEVQSLNGAESRRCSGFQVAIR